MGHINTISARIQIDATYRWPNRKQYQFRSSNICIVLHRHTRESDDARIATMMSTVNIHDLPLYGSMCSYIMFVFWSNLKATDPIAYTRWCGRPFATSFIALIKLLYATSDHKYLLFNYNTNMLTTTTKLTEFLQMCKAWAHTHTHIRMFRIGMDSLFDLWPDFSAPIED